MFGCCLLLWLAVETLCLLQYLCGLPPNDLVMGGVLVFLPLLSFGMLEFLLNADFLRTGMWDGPVMCDFFGLLVGYLL